LEGQQLGLIVTDGCPGLAAAIPTGLSASAASTLLGAQDAQYFGARAQTRLGEERGAGDLFGRKSCPRGRSLSPLSARWHGEYGPIVRRLQRDLPELLSFFAFPRHLWPKLRTTNVIERCFVEVRRRTRPMVCFVNVESMDRIIYSIFQRFNLERKTRTLNLFTQAA
jgi:hypothetical protein